MLINWISAMTPVNPKDSKQKPKKEDLLGDELKNLVDQSNENKNDGEEIDLDHITEEEMNRLKDSYHEMIKEVIKTKLEQQ